MPEVVRTLPANQAACGDLALVLGEQGGGHECQCQRYRLGPGESFGSSPVEVRRDRLREQTMCGDPASPTTTGLVGYLGGDPVGWCAVAPRSSYPGLVRNANQTAWRGRSEDRTDPFVWAVTCVFTRVGHRGRGVSRALVAASVPFAREGGARVLEAYPVTGQMSWGEEHPGALGTYLAAGFVIVHRPSKRRAVVSIDL